MLVSSQDLSQKIWFRVKIGLGRPKLEAKIVPPPFHCSEFFQGKGQTLPKRKGNPNHPRGSSIFHVARSYPGHARRPSNHLDNYYQHVSPLIQCDFDGHICQKCSVCACCVHKYCTSSARNRWHQQQVVSIRKQLATDVLNEAWTHRQEWWRNWLVILNSAPPIYFGTESATQFN